MYGFADSYSLTQTQLTFPLNSDANQVLTRSRTAQFRVTLYPEMFSNYNGAHCRGGSVSAACSLPSQCVAHPPLPSDLPEVQRSTKDALHGPGALSERVSGMHGALHCSSVCFKSCCPVLRCCPVLSCCCAVLLLCCAAVVLCEQVRTASRTARSTWHSLVALQPSRSNHSSP